MKSPPDDLEDLRTIIKAMRGDQDDLEHAVTKLKRSNKQIRLEWEEAYEKIFKTLQKLNQRDKREEEKTKPSEVAPDATKSTALDEFRDRILKRRTRGA